MSGIPEVILEVADLHLDPRSAIPSEDFFVATSEMPGCLTSAGLDHFPSRPLEFVIHVSFGAVVQYNTMYWEHRYMNKYEI